MSKTPKTGVQKAMIGMIWAGAILLIGTSALGQYDWWPEWTKVVKPVKRGTFMGVLLIITAVVTLAQRTAIRAGTQKILCADGSMFDFNESERHELVNGKWGLRLGGTNNPRWFMSTRGNEGTLLLPPDAIRKAGRHLFVPGVPERIYWSEMDPADREKLEKKGLPAPYIGITHSVTVETRGRAFVADQARMRFELNAKNENEKVLRETMRMGDQATRYQGAIIKQLLSQKERSVWERIFFPNREPVAKRTTPREQEASEAPHR